MERLDYELGLLIEKLDMLRGPLGHPDAHRIRRMLDLVGHDRNNRILIDHDRYVDVGRMLAKPTDPVFRIIEEFGDTHPGMGLVGFLKTIDHEGFERIGLFDGPSGSTVMIFARQRQTALRGKESPVLLVLAVHDGEVKGCNVFVRKTRVAGNPVFKSFIDIAPQFRLVAIGMDGTTGLRTKLALTGYTGVDVERWHSTPGESLSQGKGMGALMLTGWERQMFFDHWNIEKTIAYRLSRIEDPWREIFDVRGRVMLEDLELPTLESFGG